MSWQFSIFRCHVSKFYRKKKYFHSLFISYLPLLFQQIKFLIWEGSLPLLYVWLITRININTSVVLGTSFYSRYFSFWNKKLKNKLLNKPFKFPGRMDSHFFSIYAKKFPKLKNQKLRINLGPAVPKICYMAQWY